MGASDLIFDIFAIDRASAVFDKVALSADATATKVKRGSGIMGDALMGAGVVAAAVGVKSLEMAASFDQAMTRLTTTAGESPAALGMVSKGILAMTSQVGYSAHALADAMYEVESGGFHGAQGLAVLKSAAMGARVEGANVTDVAHALTGALNDYRGTSLTATEATNAMTAAVGHGMMRFQDLADALPSIGTRAAGANVKFQETLAALASMTADGLPAAKAATYLGQTIGQLANPTTKAAAEMQGLGINALEVSKAITSGSGHGLGDAVNMLYDGLQNHLVGAGLVSVDTFKKMTKSTDSYHKILAQLPPTVQTQIGALANMTGGVKSFQGVLAIGGKHAQQYADNLGAINQQIHAGGSTIAGFAEANKGLANQWADLKGAASSLGVEIGHDLMPAALDLTHGLQDMFGSMQRHKGTVEIVGGAIAAAAVGLTAFKVAAAGTAIVNGVLASSETALALSMAAGAVASGDMTGAMAALDIAMDANPIGMVVLAIGGLVAGGALLAQHFGVLKPILNDVWHGLQAAGTWAMHEVGAAITWFEGGPLHSLESTFGGFASWWHAHQTEIKDVATVAWHAIAGEIKVQIAVITGAIKVGWDLISTVVTTGWNVVKTASTAVWHAMSAVISSSIRVIGDVIGVALDVITGHWSHAWADLKKLAADSVHGTVDIIKNVFMGLPSAMVQIGRQIVQGLLGGIESMAKDAANAAANVAGSVLGAMKSVLNIHSPSKETEKIGLYAIDGLVVGLTRGQRAAEEAAKQVAEAMHRSLMRGLHVEKLQLGFDLQAASSKATTVADQIKNATTWADAFKGNAFAQGFDGTAGTNFTPAAATDPAAVLGQMFSYQQSQVAQAQSLDADLTKLRGELGDNPNTDAMLTAMQQGGQQGIASIHALASASTGQVQQFAGLFSQQQSYLSDAGAIATTGKSMAALQAQQAKDERQVNIIKKALHSVELQIANNGKKIRIR